MTLIERKQLKNAVERVLHIQGNYMGGILEMAVVIDMSLSKEEASERAKELVSTLKTHSEVFRNVRLNTILWKGEQDFIKEVTPLALLQMGRFFDTYESVPAKKNWDGLLATLKKFYARSKLIIVLTNETEVPVENKLEAKECMQPFLHKKMIVLSLKKNTEESSENADGDGSDGSTDSADSADRVTAGSTDNARMQIKTGTEIFMSFLR